MLWKSAFYFTCTARCCVRCCLRWLARASSSPRKRTYLRNLKIKLGMKMTNRSTEALQQLLRCLLRLPKSDVTIGYIWDWKYFIVSSLDAQQIYFIRKIQILKIVIMYIYEWCGRFSLTCILARVGPLRQSTAIYHWFNNIFVW